MNSIYIPIKRIPRRTLLNTHWSNLNKEQFDTIWEFTNSYNLNRNYQYVFKIKENNMETKYNLEIENDITNPVNREVKEMKFEDYFTVQEDLSFDEFTKKLTGMNYDELCKYTNNQQSDVKGIARHNDKGECTSFGHSLKSGSSELGKSEQYPFADFSKSLNKLKQTFKGIGNIISMYSEKPRKPLEYPLSVYVDDDYRNNFLMRRKESFIIMPKLKIKSNGSLTDLFLDFGWSCGDANPGVSIGYEKYSEVWNGVSGVINKEGVKKIIDYLSFVLKHCK